MDAQQRKLIILSIILRVGFIIYGFIQDQHPAIKFTDIDYTVFTDAASFVLRGESPYMRATYRYTPLLAMALVPCHFSSHLGFLAPIWGKIVFAASDVLVGMMIEAILKKQKVLADKRWNINACLWMLNPFVAGISTRGNAESVMALLVLATLHTLSNNQVILSAVLFGVSVHFKVYPIIYAVPIWFGIDYFTQQQTDTSRGMSTKAKRITRQSTAATSARTDSPLKPFKFLLFSQKRIVFGVVAASVFLALNLLMYQIYGQEFLNETYLYHITRKDHRHNFSLYFLHMHLSSLEASSSWSLVTSLLSFGPQLALVLLLGIFFANDIILACFLQTFAFVALNKVCTSQYFMWYLCLLPLVLPSSKLMTEKSAARLCKVFIPKCTLLLVLWVAGQVRSSI